MSLYFVLYWDVWGNEQNGWDVNDVSRHSMVGRIPDTQQDVLDLLKANNWINDYVTLDEVQIEFNCDSVQISDKSNNCPIGRVEWGV